ncbi:MAG: hypothetical protein FD180_1090 [Planctomycetota bacterium]|nr:MAG: hypothetical protein FD180_1090 [Planctomycetota bacterium]
MGRWIRGLGSKGELALGRAGRASRKAQNKLAGRNGDGDDEGDDDQWVEDGEGGPGPGGGHKRKVMGNERARKPVEFHDEQVEVPSGAGDPGEVIGDGGFAEAEEGTASVPFEKVLLKYRADMEKAMDDEAYPEEYRRAVKDYFDSLK